METRIIVAGGRDFLDYPLLEESLDAVIHGLPPEDILLISGTCKGADQMGERYAEEHGLRVQRFPADWKTYGRAAGPIRNRQMAEFASKADGILVAFWDGNSRGTASMIRLAEQKNLRISVINYTI